MPFQITPGQGEGVPDQVVDVEQNTLPGISLEARRGNNGSSAIQTVAAATTRTAVKATLRAIAARAESHPDRFCGSESFDKA